MAAINKQAACVSSIMAENQRRLLLEVLRANLRAKTAAAVGISCEQQASLQETTTHHHAAFHTELAGGASALSGSSGIHYAQKPGKEAERNIHAAVVANDNTSLNLQASVAVRAAAAEADGIHTSHTCTPETGVLDKASVDNNGGPAAGQDFQVERGAEEGSRRQSLSIALFAKLADSLPNDQGKLHFLTWEDGSCYCGHMAGGSLDGVGVYKYPDNSIYCGQWARGHLQGNGAFITSSGFLYRGAFEADQQHGAGVFVVPTGRTFFGSFRRGRLHGLTCSVSVSGGTRALLGEWRDGEFQRAFPLHARVGDFYLRAAESLDLLENVWNPLPVPAPDSSNLGTTTEEGTARVPCQPDQQVCSAAVLEALRMELPKNLLQVSASVADEEVLLATQAERHVSAKLVCSGKPIVRKRKASLLRPQGRDAREAIVTAKSRCLAQDSGGSSGGTPAPQRAATTKAQLLRWESEARKLPRIPHLNYNRVLGRWYARVRDPASGRRIWKGYTCAVHGFYEARDMAIDRLRQFSQLVSPLGTGEPDNATAAEDLQTQITSEATAGQSQTQPAESETCGGSTESAVTLAACSATGVALSEERETSAEMPLLATTASEGSSCCLDLARAHAGTDPLRRIASGGVSGCEKLAMENDDDGPQELQAGKAEELLSTASCTGNSGLPTQIELVPSAEEDPTKHGLSMVQPSAHCFGPEATGDVCCRLDTVVAQGGESMSCSRLTTTDCTESALSRCSPLSM